MRWPSLSAVAFGAVSLVLSVVRKMLFIALIIVATLSFTVATQVGVFVAGLTSSAITAITGLATPYQDATGTPRRENPAPDNRQNQFSETDEKDRALRAENERLKGSNADLRRRNTQLSTAFNRQLQTQMQYAADFDARAAETRRLTQNTIGTIKRRTAKTAAANAGSVFGESVPIYGIGFVAAATTFELASACDTMQDLHDLEMALDPNGVSPASEDELCGWPKPTPDEIWAAIKASPRQAWDLGVAATKDVGDWAVGLERPSLDGMARRIRELFVWNGNNEEK